MSIYNLSKEDFLTRYSQEKSYRFLILQNWLSKGVFSFDEMTDIPALLREKLKADFKAPILSTVIREQKEADSTKLLLNLYDNQRIECVLLKNDKNEYTACLSSEVGCTMKCEFCATGQIGFKRKLEYWEIIEQFFHLYSLNNRIDRIVYMGMGEPLCNLENVKASIIWFKEKLKMSARRITISTSGIAKGIIELGKLDLGVKLAVSLVVANDEERKKIMSAARLYSLDELKKALLSYTKEDKRRIALEYCLLSGVNMDEKSARELKKFTEGLITSVNLIAWNEIKELPFKSPTEKEIRAFEGELKRLGVPYTRRVSRGRGTSAACGMLAGDKNNH